MQRGECGGVEGGGALFDEVGKADDERLFFRVGLAGAVEGPFDGVGVEDVGKRLEFFPLSLVATFEAAGDGAVAGGFEFDVAADGLLDHHTDVGASAKIVHLHFGLGEDVGDDAFDQRADRTLELIFGLGGKGGGEGGLDLGGEFLRGGAEGGRDVGGQRHVT